MRRIGLKGCPHCGSAEIYALRNSLRVVNAAVSGHVRVKPPASSRSRDAISTKLV